MASATVAIQPRRRSLRQKLVFACVPLLVLLLVGEIGCRLARGPLHVGSFRALRVDLLRRGYPAVPDARLGYVPMAGFGAADNHWGTRVSIDADGLRRNGDGPAPTGGPCIIAVGDSFTFGDQLDDDASWPAHLERLLQRPVKNGGVFGYSFVQTVLRAEDLIERFSPDAVVVSLIASDLERNEYKKRYMSVPWFEIDRGELVLHNCPVIDTSDPTEQTQRPLKNLLGHSALIDAVCAGAFREWWIEDEKQVRMPHLVGQGAAIGMKLVERIATVCRSRGVGLLLVLQGDRISANREELALLRHAESHGVATLDLVSAFIERRATDESLSKRWFAGHMTREGNAWVAEQIAAALAHLR